MHLSDAQQAARCERHATARGVQRGIGRCLSTGVGMAAALALASWLTGCVTKDDAKKLVEALEESQPTRPDVLPVMLNRDVPVRYPPALYSRKAQGNVVLRIFIDSSGRVHPESTVVAEPSGEPAFDSAAMAGVKDLRFTPAQRRGAPMAVSILFPIYFRHPDAAPVPGDSLVRRQVDSAVARANASRQSGSHSQQLDSARR